MKNLSTFLVVAALAGTAQGQMRITEFMYDGPSSGEFIEFTNIGGSAIDMTGWSFDDSPPVAGTVSLSTFGMVQPGESVILSEATAASFRSRWNLGASVKIIGENANNLGRDDEISLFDASSALVDHIDYGDNAAPTTGSIRTQNKSGWVPYAGLGKNDIFKWILSGVGDGQGSYSSTDTPTAAIGSPGKHVVPEPMTLSLLALAAAAMIGRRGRPARRA